MTGKTIYVLGAGFSKESGFPLIGEFTSQKTVDKLKKSLNKPMRKRLEKVSNYFFDRISNRYCDDIESILNHVSVADYLYMESITEGKRSYPSEKIFDDLIWYIVKLLESCSKSEIPQIYSDFIKKVHENQDTLISFNYDLIIETILEKLGITCDYGINKTKPEKSTTLFKIHGSVNWTYCTSCKQFVFYPDYSTVKVLESKISCPNCKTKTLKPIIIPPILYKDTFYKNPLYEELIRTLWGFTSDELVQADKIVFIGFSMSNTDSYAQELFKFSSNMNNNNLECHVVTTPKPKKKIQELKTHYESVLVGHSVKIVQCTATEYMKRTLT